MTTGRFSVVVIGGGPAGISAAIAASTDGAAVLLVERDARLGGKLNQAIHDGFGFIRHEFPLTGPEYAFHDINILNQTNTVVLLQTSVLQIVNTETAFQLTLSNRHGISVIETNAVVLATGCREKTLYELGILGAKPAGIFSAGTAQYLLNVRGQLPVKKCLVLGSGNLCLNTVRALALFGAKITGVYEPGKAPRGYLDYVSHCLLDFGISFKPEHTISRVFGEQRLQGVELARSDHAGAPLRGTEVLAKCDSLIVSCGFVPEAELAAALSVPVSKGSKSPQCDQHSMSLVDGVFIAGSCLHFSDLVDYISETGEIAGRAAARYLPRERELIEINANNDFLTYAPQYIDLSLLIDDTVFFFNPSVTRTDATVRVMVNGTEAYSQKFDSIKPSETIRMEVNLAEALTSGSTIALRID